MAWARRKVEGILEDRVETLKASLEIAPLSNSHSASIIALRCYPWWGYTIKIPLAGPLVGGILLLKFRLPTIRFQSGLRASELSFLGTDFGTEDYPQSQIARRSMMVEEQIAKIFSFLLYV